MQNSKHSAIPTGICAGVITRSDQAATAASVVSSAGMPTPGTSRCASHSSAPFRPTTAPKISGHRAP